MFLRVACGMVVLALSLTPAHAGPFNLTVVQVGAEGGPVLSPAATAVFLKEFTVTGTPTNTLALPTTTSGSNSRFTLSGTATSEGALSRAADGRFLTLVGYDAAVGTAAVASTASATTNRIVARLDLAGNLNTSTRLSDVSSGNSVRGATTTNGTDIWTAGTGAAGTAGVRHTTFGNDGTMATTQLTTAPTNVRTVSVFNGQLYISTGSTPFVGVSSVGSGTPTTSGQTATLLPGMPPPPPATPSPYAFFFADANTLYVADDNTVASGGGLQKWTFDGSTWTLAYTMTTNLTTGVRGLTGEFNGTNFVLYATTTQPNANRLVTVTDTGAASPFLTLATAPANTVFRGVAFSVPEPGAFLLAGAAGGAYVLARRRRRFPS